jgi:hypothetical protein
MAYQHYRNAARIFSHLENRQTLLLAPGASVRETHLSDRTGGPPQLAITGRALLAHEHYDREYLRPRPTLHTPTLSDVHASEIIRCRLQIWSRTVRLRNHLPAADQTRARPTSHTTTAQPP